MGQGLYSLWLAVLAARKRWMSVVAVLNTSAILDILHLVILVDRETRGIERLLG